MQGKCTVIVPPNVIGLMTGTQYAKVQGNRVALVYADGTEEEATIKEVPRDYFEIVSAVQAQRGNV